MNNSNNNNIPKRRRGRSVNDFTSIKALRAALEPAPPVVEAPVRPAPLRSNSFSSSSSCEGQTEKPAVVSVEGSCSDESATFVGDHRLDWFLPNADSDESYPQTVDVEVARLQAVKSYQILQEDETLYSKDDRFERIARMTKRICNVPCCMISLIDLGRAYFLATGGTLVPETPRRLLFCSHCLVSKSDVFVVKDASIEPRFKDNPNVTGPAHVRFYAGTKIVSPEGYTIGVLCICDTEPRTADLTDTEKADLMDMAAWTMDTIASHRTMQEQRMQLERSSQMLASATHDLLTPLSGVNLSLSMLNRCPDFQSRLTEPMKECLKTATRCSDVLGQICDSLRFKNEVSLRPGGAEGTGGGGAAPCPVPEGCVGDHDHDHDHHHQSAVAKPFRISKLVERVNQVIGALPGRVPLVVQVDSAVPEVVVGDELTVFRGALNMLGTSSERTRLGSVRLNVRVDEFERSSGSPRPHLLFECEDCGDPITEEQKKLLTDSQCGTSGFGGAPGAWGGSTTTDNKNCPCGRLPNQPHAASSKDWLTSRLISFATQVRSVGGDFGVTSLESVEEAAAPVCGVSGSRMTTRFWFCIPLVVAAEETRQKTFIKRDRVEVAKDRSSVAGANEGSISCAGRKKEALVIDDSVVVRKTLSRALKSLGYETSVAENGLEGLKRLQSAPFDLVLCDFLMPVMDGLDCIREYRKWEKEHRPGFHQVIVGMSAHASGKDVERGLSMGMNAYRPKPVRLETLKQLQTSAHLLAMSDVVDKIDAEIHGEDSDKLDGVSGIERRPPFKRRKKPSIQLDEGNNDTEKVCMIASDPSSISQIEEILKKKSWRAVSVSSGEDALGLLKTRNWGAVLLDIDLNGSISGIPCISKFREWERGNRIHRQKNLCLMSACVSPVSSRDKDGFSVLNLPLGVDDAIGKPARREDIERVLLAAEQASFDAAAIVTRC